MERTPLSSHYPADVLWQLLVLECLGLQRTTDVQHSVVCKPLALRYNCHIRCGRVPPPSFKVWGCLNVKSTALAGNGRLQGHNAALVRGGIRIVRSPSKLWARAFTWGMRFYPALIAHHHLYNPQTLPTDRVPTHLQFTPALPFGPSHPHHVPLSGPPGRDALEAGDSAQGLGIRLFVFGGAYSPLATAHSDPL